MTSWISSVPAAVLNIGGIFALAKIASEPLLCELRGAVTDWNILKPKTWQYVPWAANQNHLKQDHEGEQGYHAEGSCNCAQGGRGSGRDSCKTALRGASQAWNAAWDRALAEAGVSLGSLWCTVISPCSSLKLPTENFSFAGWHLALPGVCWRTCKTKPCRTIAVYTVLCIRFMLQYIGIYWLCAHIMHTCAGAYKHSCILVCMHTYTRRYMYLHIYSLLPELQLSHQWELPVISIF